MNTKRRLMMLVELNPTLDFKKEIFEILEYSGSKHFLEKILTQISCTKDLVKFIHRYSVFNGNFAGGVINLGGAFHIRQDIFRDESEIIHDCADRSSKISTYIFFAAEDEYFDRVRNSRVTHRELGQILLKNTLRFFDINPQLFEQQFSISPAILDNLEEIKQGYCLNRENSEEEILHGLGFHIGAELLADQEFNILHQYLCKEYPQLVKFLKGERTEYGNSAYTWIELHTSVESEHFEYAILAAEEAISYYCGLYTKNEVRNMIIEGFNHFSRFQISFFNNILKG
ncbi:hypothetical protein IQ241_24375 [Romeria aff. gracilis LEGE 07310]|uniref:Uncharacterized protein n=1 Tax=Vasconcelosia minhoensis LEGE 07310 TaxID=915328 RepID=A0A8J7AT50_9CYAN|nr:hypothetical protein [Romeria gracilis]MBE9080386.1 hypothetical protein [Romeria aff. gracilis LEGE 07310]